MIEFILFVMIVVGWMSHVNGLLNLEKRIKKLESKAGQDTKETGLASDKSPVRPTSDSDSSQSASTIKGGN
jgi:hypothetical protein